MNTGLPQPPSVVGLPMTRTLPQPVSAWGSGGHLRGRARSRRNSSSSSSTASTQGGCGRARILHSPSPMRGGENGEKRGPCRIGNYIVGDSLGTGAHSQVFAARHFESGAAVAVKRVSKSDAKAVMTVRNEVDVYLHVLSNLRDVADRRNLVELDDIIETQNSLYLVVERVMDGDVMESVIRKGGGVRERDTRWIFRNVVCGLLQLQAAGVAHRDVKPENILVDFRRKVAKLTDFGLSKILELSPATSPRESKDSPQKGEAAAYEKCVRAVGTQTYAAPEVIKGKPHDGLRADVYSLGITMLCTHTRRYPDRSGAHFPDFSTGPAAVLSHNLKDLIARLTHPQPARRPSLEDVLRHPWFAEGHPGNQYDTAAAPPLQGGSDVFGHPQPAPEDDGECCGSGSSSVEEDAAA